MRFIHIIVLLFFISLVKAQSPCKCVIPEENSGIVFEQFRDNINPVQASQDFFTEHLDKYISVVGLTEDFLEAVKVYFGDDGKVCDIKYKRNPTPAIQNHIREVLGRLPKLIKTCVSTSTSIVIGQEFRPTEAIYKVASNMPIFNGCNRKIENEKRNECTIEKLENYINSHPLYNKLTMQQGTYIVNFVITKEGKTTLFSTKRGDFDGNEDKVKQIIYDMPLWQPGNQRGENVNILFSIPIKIR